MDSLFRTTQKQLEWDSFAQAERKAELMLKSEKRESQKLKKRYGPRRHKMLGINKWARRNREVQKQIPETDGQK